MCELTHQTPLEVSANVINEVWAVVLNVVGAAGRGSAEEPAEQPLSIEAMRRK